MATTYFGVDISVNQGTMNWSTLTSALGANGFVFIQAAAVTFAGTGTVADGQFTTNQAQARTAGIARGFYFFVQTTTFNNSSRYGTSDPAVIGQNDANYFISIVGGLQRGEIMILDFDLAGGVGYTGQSDTYAYNFCTTIINHYGSTNLPTCVIYSSESLLSGSFEWPLTSGVTYTWIAAYDGGGGTNWGAYSLPAWHSKGYPGDGPSPTDYIWHQYTSSGNGATYGAQSTFIDLDSFYSLNNTINDFGAFGYLGGGPAPTSGIHTTFSQFNITPTFTEPYLQTIAVPVNAYDRVIYSTTWSDSVTSASWPVNRIGPSTGIGQTAYPVGNYMYTLNGSGNGAWNDFGFIYSVADLGTFIGDIPPVVIQPIVSNTGQLSFDITVATGTGPQTVNYTVHVALLATNSPVAMAGVPSVTQRYAFSNVVPGVVPPYAVYRRISIDTNHSGTGSGSFVHNQTGIPNVIAFPYDSGSTFINPTAWTSTGAVTTAFGVSMDATNVYYNIDTALAGAFFRVYKDN